MKKLLTNRKYLAFTQFAMAVVYIIDMILFGSRVLSAIAVAFFLIMGIALLVYQDKPDSTELKEDR